MIWFKLVGAVDRPVPPDWEHDRPELFTKIHFPRNKRPNKLSNGERIILYAVGTRVLIATQTVYDTYSASKERKGPPGSPEDRWPWEIAVTTDYYCSPLDEAPKLREVSSNFADRYIGKFREGSHWRIDPDEYDTLAAAIEACGRQYRA